MAQEEGISVTNFIVTSVSNEVVRRETRDFFVNTATSCDGQAFTGALAVIYGDTG